MRAPSQYCDLPQVSYPKFLYTPIQRVKEDKRLLYHDTENKVISSSQLKTQKVTTPKIKTSFYLGKTSCIHTVGQASCHMTLKKFKMLEWSMKESGDR